MMARVLGVLLACAGGVSAVRFSPTSRLRAMSASSSRCAPITSAFKLSVSEEDLKVGQVIPCTILAQTEANDYTVDIGASRPALLPAVEVALDANATSPTNMGQGWAELLPGETYEAQVLRLQPTVEVSLVQVHRGVAWARVDQLMTADVTYLGTVQRVGKTGATVEVEQLPAFLPWSHWHLPRTQKRRNLVGRTLEVKFLEADRRRNRLVVSHRRFQLQERLEQLQPGALVDGTIDSIRPYGAIVTLAEGLDGLLHISQAGGGVALGSGAGVVRGSTR
jgi:small subunit ribosomal protein S1